MAELCCGCVALRWLCCVVLRCVVLCVALCCVVLCCVVFVCVAGLCCVMWRACVVGMCAVERQSGEIARVNHKTYL
jgi:hypothetical protein